MSYIDRYDSIINGSGSFLEAAMVLAAECRKKDARILELMQAEQNARLLISYLP